jgi:predicted DCC family thiol-disulfide oxidoreductase YuxK
VYQPVAEVPRNECLTRNSQAIIIFDGTCRVCIAPRVPNMSRTSCDYGGTQSINFMAVDHSEGQEAAENVNIMEEEK